MFIREEACRVAARNALVKLDNIIMQKQHDYKTRKNRGK